MEVKSLNTKQNISPQLKEKREREKKHKEEATKNFGDFLINITNFCFDKCIEADNIYMSKSEEKCVESFFEKYTEAHSYALGKFQEINEITESNKFERSKDYGDYYGALAFYFREDLEKLGRKYKNI
jgi:hypothetical protein